MQMQTYVNFNGNCEEAFRFYAQHLGGKTEGFFRWKDMPDAEKHMPPGMENKVLHTQMQLAGKMLLGADVPGAEPMRSAYLTLKVDSKEEAERIYNVLSEGGEVFMKMGETFFAERFGQFRDRFGINWMVIREKAM